MSSSECRRGSSHCWLMRASCSTGGECASTILTGRYRTWPNRATAGNRDQEWCSTRRRLCTWTSRMSWMIGDTDADVAAGQAAGCRTVLVEHPASSHKRGGAISPDRRAPDLVHAAALVVPRPSDPRSEEDDLGGSSSQGPLAQQGRGRRRGIPPDVLWDVLIGAVVVVVMASPVLFTDRAFMIDFTNGGLAWRIYSGSSGIST